MRLLPFMPGPAGASLIATGVGVLAGWPWALIALGVFLLVLDHRIDLPGGDA